MRPSMFPTLLLFNSTFPEAMATVMHRGLAQITVDFKEDETKDAGERRADVSNAAAVALWASMVDMLPEDSVIHAETMIDAQDAAAGVRFVR